MFQCLLEVQLDVWLKEIAPSTELRRWYGHDSNKWTEFKARYTAELEANPGKVEELLAEVQAGIVTFLYSSKENQRKWRRCARVSSMESRS